MVYIMLSLAAIFWGGNYVVGKIMVGNTNPVLLSEMRWFLTSMILVSFNLSSLIKSRFLIGRNLKTIAPLAVLGQVLFPVTLYVGLQYTSSLNAAIYLSATPTIVLFLNWLIFRDYISHSNIVGVVISTLGVAWLVTKGDPENLRFLENFTKGDLWTMLSAISWGFYCSFLRKKPTEIAGNVFVTICAIIGTITLVPFSVFSLHNGQSLSIAWTWGTFVGLGYLVVFPSWLSYLLWSKGIAVIGATRGEIFTHLIPLSAGLLSVVFLGTTLQAYHLESVLAIVIGVFLCSKHGRPGTDKNVQSPASTS